MTKSLLFSFPGYEEISTKIQVQLGCELGDLNIHNFPDAESYVKLNSSVQDKEVILVCGLDNPNQKAMALMFFAKTAKELGAKKIGLVTPYLGYMRQDKRFHEGEAVTSNIFAKFLSQHFDWLVTIDPHLHRHKSLDEIYSIPSKVIHASNLISAWIKDNVENPLLIGPDEESKQWVSRVAKDANAPFIVLNKVRHGDREVEVSVPDVEKYQNHNPVLVDDIISTAKTMIETITHLENAKMNLPICIGVHAIFSGDAYEELKNSGAKEIITCNTIKHHTNKIDVSSILANAIKDS